MKMKNLFTSLNLVIKQISIIVLLKVFKNKAVKSHLTSLILVGFKKNLQAKMLLHNFQALMTKTLKRKSKILMLLK